MSRNGYWWCPECKEAVDPCRVNFQEMHDVCGHPVEIIYPREFGRIKDLESSLSAEREKVRVAEEEIRRHRKDRHDTSRLSVCPSCGFDALPSESERVRHLEENVRAAVEALENSQDILDLLPGTWTIEGIEAAFNKNKDALRALQSSEAPHESSKFYHADGTFEVLPADEVRRRRIACAEIVEASVEEYRNRFDANGAMRDKQRDRVVAAIKVLSALSPDAKEGKS